MTFISGDRDRLSGSVRAEQQRLRRFRIPNAYLETHPGNIYWNGLDSARGTIVQPTGSQTLTENYETMSLDVSSIASIAANDVACLLYPVALSTGDTWGCQVFCDTSSTNQLLLAGIVMANGTTATSAVAGNFAQKNNNGNFYTSARGGTITNLSAEVGGFQFGAFQQSPWFLTLQYSAANTFVGTIRITGGVTVSSTGNLSSTQTPTHLGLAWTNWNTSPTTPVVRFGPLVKMA